MVSTLFVRFISDARVFGFPFAARLLIDNVRFVLHLF